MIVLRIASIIVLLTAAACREMPTPTGPDAQLTFNGTWVGTSRVVSCEPAGLACAAYVPGFERYFSATLNRQDDAVEGSVILSPPGPLALPYGFPIRGRVLASGQLSFERQLVDEREPRFSGDLTIRIAVRPELVGRMTEQGTPSLGQPSTLVWDVTSVRR